MLLSQLKMLMALWDVVRNGRVGFANKPAARFEENLARYLTVPHLLGVASGTDALMLALKACDIKPGAEVIVPATSAFSSAGAVAWIGAVPIFVDVELGTMNIDPAKIEAAITPKTKAIIAVHLNGLMADMEKIAGIAKKHSLALIEDAAQAIGSRYQDKPIGYFSDAACLSFNPTKIFSTYGDGGAVVTFKNEVAERVTLMRTYGAKPHEIHKNHPVVGVSSRLNPLHAAVLNAKMPNLPALINQARENFFSYQKILAEMKNLTLPEETNKDYFINGHRFFILTNGRDLLLEKLKKEGVAARADHRVPLPYFPVLNMRNYKKRDFLVAERVSQEAIFLPTHGKIPQSQFEKTAEVIKNHSTATKNEHLSLLSQ